MVFGRLARAARAGIRVDPAIAVAAVSALVLSVVIIGLYAGAGRFAGGALPSLAGMRLLAPDDTLVTFEDFELGAPGWSGGRMDRTTPAFGGILGRFAGTDGLEAVSRIYTLPEGSSFATVTFDLHAIDDWALDDILVFINDVEVLRRSFTTRPDERDRQRALIADLPWISAQITETARSGTARGFSDGAEATSDQTIRVEMTLANPPSVIRLGFGATLATQDLSVASWAVDNLEIVTTARRAEPTSPLRR